MAWGAKAAVPVVPLMSFQSSPQRWKLLVSLQWSEALGRLLHSYNGTNRIATDGSDLNNFDLDLSARFCFGRLDTTICKGTSQSTAWAKRIVRYLRLPARKANFCASLAVNYLQVFSFSAALTVSPGE